MKCLFTVLCFIPFAAAQVKAPAGRDLTPVRVGTSAEPKTSVDVPRGYAVVIGISTYKNLSKQDNLSFAASDAENVYNALLSKEGGNIQFDNVKKLIGPDATLANMRNALEQWLPSKAQPSDRVIVFFVGHGVVDAGGKGYLAPYDIDTSRVGETAYPMDRLGKVLSQDVKAGWKVLLVDACHSGQITVNSTLERVNDSFRGLPQGVLTLTSSHASEKSYEDPALAGGSGVFSYFLVKGWLGQADVDPPYGVVSADELVTYVRREVRDYARKQKLQQNPWESGDFPDDLIMGYNPKRTGPFTGTQVELENGNLIVESNLDGVQVSVDGQPYGVAGPGAAHLNIPGLSSGMHKIEGARKGYDPASIDVNVVPGTTQTVSLRLLYPRVVKPAAKALYDQGDEIWKRSNANAGDLVKAADRFSRALKEDPTYSAAALELCRVQQTQGKTADALKSCSTALGIDTDYIEARTQYGVILLENGDYPESVRQLQRAVLQDSKNAFVQSLLAEALYMADRPQEAEAAANQAISLDGSSAQAYLERGEARRSQKRFDESIADYRRALQLQEYGSGFLRVAAYWAIGTGMQKNRSGRRSLYHSLGNTAYHGLCAAEIGKEDYHEAVAYCKRALSIDKDDTDSYQLLAVSYSSLFNLDNRREYLLQAKDSLEATLRINPHLENEKQLRSQLVEINEHLPLVR
jgi:tetratricopeptide (TPR) repeat protein